MANQTVNIGSSANDRTGDSLRSAFNKINENFTELYTALGLGDGTLNAGAFTFTGSVIDTDDSSNITINKPVTVNGEIVVDGVNADIYGAKTVGSFINFGTNASVVNMDAAVDMQTYSIGNVGTITASQFNGTNLSVDTGFFISITGDLTGSVFADDSSLLVDSVNGTIPGYISIASLKSIVAGAASYGDFQTAIAAL